MGPQTQTEEFDHQDECRGHPHHYPYVCVHCGCGCQALYRQLTASSSSSPSKPTKSSSSLSSLKAVSCQHCHQSNVDPFMERELLLVVIDWILLRPEAYRHVLFNIINIAQDKNNNEKENDDTFGTTAAASSSSSMIRRNLSRHHLFQFGTISCLLIAYLKWDAVLSEGGGNYDGGGGGGKLQISSILVLISVLELAVQYTALYGCLRLQNQQLQRVPQKKRYDDNRKLSYQILWALIIPTMIHVVTLCVLTVWENNSQTIRIISSILVICWQWLGLSLLLLLPSSSSSGGENSNIKKDSTTKSFFSNPFIAPIVGMISLSLWRYIMTNVILMNDNYAVDFLTPDGSRNINPCLGLQLDDIITAFSSMTDAVLAGGRHSDTIHLDAWSVPNFCLT